MTGNSSEIVIIGAGISGIRSAIDLAEMGCYVYLIDKAASIGGILPSLDHQFPNNHCGMCRMLPMIDRDSGEQSCLKKGLSHNRINVLTSAEVKSVTGNPGNFKVTLSLPAKEIELINIAGVIVSTGAELFNPSSTDCYGFGILPNVVTSLTFEQIVSSSGTFRGKPVRPSDNKPFQKIAWVQCAGSRNIMIGADYCSSVCCMVAIKEAMLAHDKIGKAVETTIFYMDMRTYGRDFQRYRDRAEKEIGIRFVRCRVHSIEPADNHGDLKVYYVDSGGKLENEIFDIVVLSTGQQPHQTLPAFADKEGVIIADPNHRLKDISESVIYAGIASGKIIRMLHPSTGMPDVSHTWQIPSLKREIPPPILLRGEVCSSASPREGKINRKYEKEIHPVEKCALVIGAGPAGLRAALSLAENNIRVVILEKTDKLGGNLYFIHEQQLRQSLEKLLSDVQQHPKITSYTHAEIIKNSGLPGQFISSIHMDSGKTETLRHGVTILATGGQTAKTHAYGLGTSDRIVTQFEFENCIRTSEFAAQPLHQVVMIQCGGTREEPQNYCSRICCLKSLNQAIHIRKIHPETEVYVFYRDMMAYGDSERIYTEARREKILFIPFDLNRKPEVCIDNGKPMVNGYDPILNEDIHLHPDWVSVSVGVVPNPIHDLIKIFKIEATLDGFVKEADSKWRPVDTGREGIFIAGLAKAPMRADEAVREGEAAAYRALRLLLNDAIHPQKVSAYVRYAFCSRCELCVSACPYSARYLDKELNRMMVDYASCQGCGSCAVVCPNSATIIGDFEDNKMMNAIEAVL